MKRATAFLHEFLQLNTGKEQTMIQNFLKDETGLELSEYAVAAALVAIACVVAFTTLGEVIGSRLTFLADTVNG
jgi:pilus assembly protein Flp/PilA